MKEYDLFVNGQTLHVSKETDGTAIIYVPRDFIYGSNPQHACDLFNIEPSQRDLTFLKDRLAQRRKNHHSKPGNPKPLTPEDARVIAQIRRRNPRTPSLSARERLRLKRGKDSKFRILPPIPEDERREQVIRRIKRRQEENQPTKPTLRTETFDEGGGLFEKIEPSQPSYPDHLKKFARRW